MQSAMQMNREELLFPGQGSFVIQFRSVANIEQGRFTGRVEHVASGRITHFKTLDALRAFVREVLAERQAISADGAWFA